MAEENEETPIELNVWKPDPRIAAARLLLDTGAPTIMADNWALMNADGWRIQDNHTPKHLEEYIKLFQDTHGRDKVTLGWRFHKTLGVPVEDDVITGLYIRDLDERIESLREDLKNDNLLNQMIEEWSQ